MAYLAGRRPTQVAGEYKVFVGNLPANTSQDDLTNLFRGYGELKESVLLPPKASVSDQRCGFVKFAELQDANSAIQNLNGVEWGGSKLAVRMADAGPKPTTQHAAPAAAWPQAAYNAYAALGAAFGAYGVPLQALGWYPPAGVPSYNAGGAHGAPASGNKLFVGNIPSTWVQDNLTALFAPYGMLEETVLLSRRGINDTQCGFVKFVDAQSASSAQRALAGSNVEGSELVVRFADKAGRQVPPGGPMRTPRGPSAPGYRPY